MAQNYIPEPSPNSPSGITLLDLVYVYKSPNNEVCPTRLTNINDLIGPYVRPNWGNIVGSIDNQKDLLALVSLRI